MTIDEIDKEIARHKTAIHDLERQRERVASTPRLEIHAWNGEDAVLGPRLRVVARFPAHPGVQPPKGWSMMSNVTSWFYEPSLLPSRECVAAWLETALTSLRAAGITGASWGDARDAMSTLSRHLKAAALGVEALMELLPEVTS